MTRPQKRARTRAPAAFHVVGHETTMTPLSRERREKERERARLIASLVHVSRDDSPPTVDQTDIIKIALRSHAELLKILSRYSAIFDAPRKSLLIFKVHDY